MISMGTKSRVGPILMWLSACAHHQWVYEFSVRGEKEEE